MDFDVVVKPGFGLIRLFCVANGVAVTSAIFLENGMRVPPPG